jgi:uncharacterized repeat protein (TIGR01451 family)
MYQAVVRRSRIGTAALVLALAGSALVVQAQPAHAEQRTVRVEIFSVLQVENPDSDGTDGDYFAEVKIGDGGFESTPRIEDDDFPVDWKFSRSVEVPASREVPVTIRLKDYDDFLNGGDDVMDLSPKDQNVELDLKLNVDTDWWSSSDVMANLGVAEGDGDHGYPEANDGRRSRILFSLTTQSSNDVDGDGIPNLVERFGIRRPNGDVVQEHGMDPCRKTILMQLDSMYQPPVGTMPGHNHAPKTAAQKEVVDAFDKAPLPAMNPCTFGGPERRPGVDFVFLAAKSIPEQAAMGLDDGYRAARDRNFDPALRPYAHYGIMVHDQKAGSSSSGLCCEKTQGQKDILISLGSWADETGVPVGKVRDQSGSIMHELGHALGLGHGGNDPTNLKPNYLSVMNYAFDPGGIPVDGAGTARLDYSHSDLRDLPKNSLDEYVGVGRIAGSKDITTWKDKFGKNQSGKISGPLNWDGSTDSAGLPVIDDQNVAVDINAGDDVCILPGADGELDTDAEDGDSKVGGAYPAILTGDKPGCQTTGDDGDDTGRAPVLTGYDDWGHIHFRAIAAEGGGAEVAVEHGPDITFEQASKRQAEFDAFFDPDLVTTKTVDRSDAEPGQTLAYTVDVKNTGTGTATAVTLTDTFPDGTSESRNLANIAADRSRAEQFDHLVPCTTTDGTVLTNRATVTGTDLGDSPESNRANNGSSASTTIHAPKLTLAKSVTPTVNAGEPVVTRLTVANTGTGGATSVTVTDTVPAGAYYSVALDLGAGPRPTSVTRNPDGTTTLTWALGTIAGTSSAVIEYTWRSSLLLLPGTALTGAATASYSNTGGCVFDPVSATATNTVTQVQPTRDPLSAGYLTTHPVDRTAELRARIQATDQRYDADGNGAMSDAEALAALTDSGVQPGQLARQELAVLFDLAGRRINAGTAIGGKLAGDLGTANVRDAVRLGMATLALPVSSANSTRYSDATTLLDRIANNKIEQY